ncbi:hypothetical protein NC99_11170 [Sunxiuqinia dokdonensis]|uniref:Uncharacterized protein n=1 Tax=Sunxiuqinia dokdonensis TaxID=1409788 RepID=A0A0L8VD37_9BACT|nr:hypothetical protein NC99_11170 [Sunxiuqinia dokdonensis]
MNSCLSIGNTRRQAFLPTYIGIFFLIKIEVSLKKVPQRSKISSYSFCFSISK